MDYLVASTLTACSDTLVICAYDIGCQYKINFRERMSKMPPRLKLDFQQLRMTIGLPVWHGGIPEEACRSRNSLKYQDGVGRTDGEGTERIWSRLNPASYSTKEMGEGARHDALEDKVDSLNFGKNVGQGKLIVWNFMWTPLTCF